MSNSDILKDKFMVYYVILQTYIHMQIYTLHIQIHQCGDMHDDDNMMLA